MEKSKLHYSWLIFAGCCVMSFVGLGLIINTQGLFFTPVGNELGFTRTQIALMLTIQNITQMITMPIAGKMFPKYNAKVLLTGSFVVFAGAIIIIIATSSKKKSQAKVLSSSIEFPIIK